MLSFSVAGFRLNCGEAVVAGDTDRHDAPVNPRSSGHDHPQVFKILVQSHQRAGRRSAGEALVRVQPPQPVVARQQIGDFEPTVRGGQWRPGVHRGLDRLRLDEQHRVSDRLPGGVDDGARHGERLRHDQFELDTGHTVWPGPIASGCTACTSVEPGK